MRILHITPRTTRQPPIYEQVPQHDLRRRRRRRGKRGNTRCLPYAAGLRPASSTAQPGRNSWIAVRPDDSGHTDVEHCLILLTCEWDANPALRYRTAEGGLWIEFAEVEFEKDVVMGEREVDGENGVDSEGKENAEVDGYNADGEETGQEKATVASAEDDPFIDF
ncbi:uncharacterized protein BDZ99DRAFT_521161 [Mytilinidion resinicola]|uniref:Uncharacterized protein n=1 Tax=Mytilinidion resinicola TaxID=574789 RepID=A0A6A6YLT9_9PEZI|nr:uncharacterized protein BDZ99DRAFT_521161 [Mytilinidion resinicola]KAF2809842.1 hypothetical protein BDZ99DRAFT_521161 [Mytilinidion resinicola]